MQALERERPQAAFPPLQQEEAYTPPFPGPRRPIFTFIDLFAGIGGFRLGLQAVGGRCLFSSEINEAAQEVYDENYGERPHGDITLAEVQEQVPGKFDVLAAGFPCQPFSISGKMRGFQDTRGTLIYEVFKLLDAHQPPVVLLENVKHLRYHDGGKTLRVILDVLTSLGYQASCEVLNAVNFGVPQNRERLIIVGIRGMRFDFFNLRHKRMAPVLEDFLDSQGPFEYLEEPFTLIDSPHQQPSGLIFAGYRNKAIRKRGVRPDTLERSRVHKQPNRIYDAHGVHPALPSQETSGRFWILVDGQVRKLTLNECYRIMGFPSEFRRAKAVSEQYRQIGNSVCVPMVEAIMGEILKQWKNERRDC